MQRLYRCYLRIARHEIRIPSLIYQYIGVDHKLVFCGTIRFTWNVSYIRTHHVRNPRRTYMGSDVFRIWVETLCFHFHTGSYLPSLWLVPLHSVWSLTNDFCSNEFHKFFLFFFGRREFPKGQASKFWVPAGVCFGSLNWFFKICWGGGSTLMLENPMVKIWSGIFPGKLYSAFLWVVGVILKYLEWSLCFRGEWTSVMLLVMVDVQSDKPQVWGI